ncbi:MAG: flippase-like domain-containing protein [Actinobacteria bacterium]|nr:flippase-like domain-containing protein [Actinomycetota bacterium]
MPGLSLFGQTAASGDDPEALRRPSILRAMAVPSVATIVLTVVLWRHFDEIFDTIKLLSVKAAVGLVLLHLLALVLRAEAWSMCLNAAGAPVRRKLLHGTSSLRFLADTVVPTYVGAWVRIALIRRYAGRPPHAPTIGQMFTADGLLLLVEGFITIGLVVIAVFVSPIEWWAIVTFGAIVVAASVLVRYLYRRHRDREFVKTIEVLRSPRRRVALAGLLAVVLTVQPIRFYIAFNALGLEPSASDALVAFLLTSLYGALPIGPGPSVVAATATLFGGAVTIAQVGSSGMVLVATAIVAAAVYSVWGGAVLLRGSVFEADRPELGGG